MTPFSAFFHPSFIKCEFSHLLIQPVMPYDFQQTDKDIPWLLWFSIKQSKKKDWFGYFYGHRK